MNIKTLLLALWYKAHYSTSQLLFDYLYHEDNFKTMGRVELNYKSKGIK